MSNILIGWLKDKLGRKIAPRTLAELVQMDDGTSVADVINGNPLKNLIAIPFSGTTDGDGDLSLPLEYSSPNGYKVLFAYCNNDNVIVHVFHGTSPNYVKAVSASSLQKLANTQISGYVYVIK